MRHLTLECPRCQTKGSVRIDELDLQFRCKSCRAKFYVDRQGQCVLGAARVQKEGEWLTESTATGRKFDPLGPLIEAVASIPYTARLIIAAVGLIALMFGLFRWVSGPAAVEVPENIEERADYIARAFVDGDLERLESIVAPGTIRAANLWIENQRPAWWSSSEIQGGTVRVELELKYRSYKTGAACVLASLFRPATGESSEKVPAKSSAPPGARVTRDATESNPDWLGVNLLLYFVLDDEKLWVLDADRTLRGT